MGLRRPVSAKGCAGASVEKLKEEKKYDPLIYSCLLSPYFLNKEATPSHHKSNKAQNLQIDKRTYHKRKVGSAIEHLLPELQGKIITNLYDTTTDGDYRLFIVECNPSQNRANLSLERVSELSVEEAISLAEKYQPERKMKRINPETRKEEEITIPQFDLRKYLN